MTILADRSKKIGFPKQNTSLNRSYMSLKIKILQDKAKIFLRGPSNEPNHFRNSSNLDEAKLEIENEKFIPLSSSNKIKSKTYSHLGLSNYAKIDTQLLKKY